MSLPGRRYEMRSNKARNCHIFYVAVDLHDGSTVGDPSPDRLLISRLVQKLNDQEQDRGQGNER